MKELTKEQKIVLTAYTGTLCCSFPDFHEDVENRLGQPVFTHMFGNKDFVDKHIKPLYEDDFMAMIGATNQ